MSALLALLLAQVAPPVRITPPPPLVRTNVPPDVTEFSRTQGWLIAVDHTLNAGCFVLMSYRDGTVLRMGFDQAGGTGYIILGNTAWRSLEQGKDYRIELQFDYESPWWADATGYRFPSGGDVYLSTTFHQTDFLAEFMAKQTLDIRYQGRSIARLDLRGSGAAGLELLRCQEANPGTNVDPFRANPPSPPAPSDPFGV